MWSISAYSIEFYLVYKQMICVIIYNNKTNSNNLLTKNVPKQIHQSPRIRVSCHVGRCQRAEDRTSRRSHAARHEPNRLETLHEQGRNIDSSHARKWGFDASTYIWRRLRRSKALYVHNGGLHNRVGHRVHELMVAARSRQHSSLLPRCKQPLGASRPTHQ